jgi:hypothetical protein
MLSGGVAGPKARHIRSDILRPSDPLLLLLQRLVISGWIKIEDGRPLGDLRALESPSDGDVVVAVEATARSTEAVDRDGPPERARVLDAAVADPIDGQGDVLQAKRPGSEQPDHDVSGCRRCMGAPHQAQLAAVVDALLRSLLLGLLLGRRLLGRGRQGAAQCRVRLVANCDVDHRIVVHDLRLALSLLLLLALTRLNAGLLLCVAVPHSGLLTRRRRAVMKLLAGRRRRRRGAGVSFLTRRRRGRRRAVMKLLARRRGRTGHGLPAEGVTLLIGEAAVLIRRWEGVRLSEEEVAVRVGVDTIALRSGVAVRLGVLLVVALVEAALLCTQISYPVGVVGVVRRGGPIGAGRSVRR